MYIISLYMYSLSFDTYEVSLNSLRHIVTHNVSVHIDTSELSSDVSTSLRYTSTINRQSFGRAQVRPRSG